MRISKGGFCLIEVFGPILMLFVWQYVYSVLNSSKLSLKTLKLILLCNCVLNKAMTVLKTNKKMQYF